MPQPFAHAVINNLLPDHLGFDKKDAVTKKTLKKRLVRFAKEDPVQFNEIVPLIKQAGDMFATYEGISVGLDDIEPDYKKRDAIINSAAGKLKGLTDPTKRSNVYIDAQQKMLKLAASHKGDLGLMARSGGRGNMAQLMKTVATPLVVSDFNDRPVDSLLTKSYAEGLSPAQYWIAGAESRGLVVKGQIGTAEPGDVGKIMSNATNRQVVTTEDCKTKNGVRMDATDVQIIGRYLARNQQYGTRNTPVDGRLVAYAIEKDPKAFLFVRSPLTCEAPSGTCSYCQGTLNDGKLMEIGQNAGLRSVQAAAEPLVQMALSSKHGISLVHGAVNIPRGITGLRQYLEAPKNFMHKAELASVSGKVTNIKQAQHGGNYVFVDDKEHYVSPNVGLKVKLNQRVAAGDALSDGVPHPGEVVEYKGLGEGRRYLTDAVHGIYEDAGISIDKRNIENIVVNGLSHVRVGNSPRDSGIVPGEIIKQNQVDSILRGQGAKVPIDKTKGRVLAENYLHHVAGTTVNSTIRRDLRNSGISEVNVLPEDSQFQFEPFMSSIIRTPLMNNNWLNKLGHRYLRQTLTQAAHGAEEAETTGYAPIAALVSGRFGQGTDGKY